MIYAFVETHRERERERERDLERPILASKEPSVHRLPSSNVGNLI